MLIESWPYTSVVSFLDHKEEENDAEKKKLVIVSARVHPGETNASWMMKGLLSYVTGPADAAKVSTRVTDTIPD